MSQEKPSAADILTTQLGKAAAFRVATMDEAVNQIKLLQDQIAEINNRLLALDTSTKIEEYPEVRVTNVNVRDISLDMFKTLPEFNGDRNKYSAWRNAATNVMKIFNNVTDQPKYFEALNIVRNKFVGSASDALTNYNTVLNFDAIISRLDFTFADKRPIYIIEQELNVLQQRSMSIEDFYDEVNKKLNTLINKINMTYKERGIAEAMIKDASMKALRTFITGLSGFNGRTLYASNPQTLPDAYAKLQTIINDQERIKFANQFNQPKSDKQIEPSRMNASFKPKTKKQIPTAPALPKPEPMDVDRSTTINVGRDNKRPRSAEFMTPRKHQRVNQTETKEGKEKSKEKRKKERATQSHALEAEDDSDSDTSNNEKEDEDNDQDKTEPTIFLDE